MIFVAEIEERTLYAFTTESEAIAHCEGLDVAAGTWLFWNGAGEPLEAQFIAPNKRGLFTVKNGKYTLISAAPNHHAPLVEALEEILHYESASPFESKASVRNYLASNSKS
jgi:hypothetical protein